METPCPDAFVCPIMHNGQPMQDPVFASDGYTYERSAIAEWLGRNTKSPLTGLELEDKRLVPNHHLKSMIEQWREEQKGEAARKELDAMLNKIRLCKTSDEVTATLLAISEFVVETETLIPAEQLKRVGRMLDGDEQLWSEAVKGALEAVDAQCEAMTRTLQGKLRKAKLLYSTSLKTSARMAGKEAGIEKKFRSVQDQFKQEVDILQRGLGKAAEEEEENEQESPGGEKKRKRGAGASGASGSKQAKPDMGGMFVEGMELFWGTNFREKNEFRGQVVIEAAADAGVACAEAECIYRGWGGRKEDKAEAFQRFEHLAGDGGEHQATAMNKLGVCYKRGRGVVKDEAKAVEWYTKAADAGDTNAMCNLGFCFNNGEGVGKDEAKAVEWYTKAAEAGNIYAFLLLGFCYMNGKGVGKDEAKAVEWHTKAAEAGDSTAMFSLGICFKNGKGVGKDEAKAVEWHTKAADAGDTNAMFNLGFCYRNGIGVGKDEAKAFEWYTKAVEAGNSAAEAGNSVAMCILGSCYMNGNGVGKDEAKAVEWYTKAAYAGNSAAMCILGSCYMNGKGVGKDEAKAVEWYIKAAEAGNSSAMSTLGLRGCHPFLQRNMKKMMVALKSVQFSESRQ